MDHLQERERLCFSERAAINVPYRGPLYQLRPWIKWTIFFCWVVYLVVIVLILRGDTLLGAVKVLAIPTLVCILYLSRTRDGSRGVTMDAVFIFREQEMTAFYDSYPAAGRDGTPRIRQVSYTVQYKDITKIGFNRRIARLEIYGTLHIQIAEYAADGTPVPCYDKIRKGAVINSLLPADRVDEIITAVCRNSGWPRERIVEYG
ncbi:MAG TPA: hypothetical protein H9764_08670 [Candidatus Flavonifractor merdavium]|nr:hypothetical protein [Candidatus Flavonifractor merdavium]